MMTVERRNGAVVTLRSSDRKRPSPAPVHSNSAPPWVPVGRTDFLAQLYGFTAREGWPWVLIVGEALADGNDLMPESRCREIAGRHWDALWIILLRRRLASAEGDKIRIRWVADVLTAATTMIARAKTRRAGKGGGNGS